MEDSTPASSETTELTYYELFGLNPTASIEAITEVFLEISARLKSKTPELNDEQLASALSLFASVEEAYNCLRDPVKRAQYDERQKIMPLHEQRVVGNGNDNDNVVTIVATALISSTLASAIELVVQSKQDEEDAIADQIELNNFLNENVLTTEALVEASRNQIQRLLSPLDGNVNVLQQNLDISNNQSSNDKVTPVSILKTPETPRDPERRKTVTFVDPVLSVFLSEPQSRSTSGDRSSMEVGPTSDEVQRASLPGPDAVLSSFLSHYHSQTLI